MGDDRTIERYDSSVDPDDWSGESRSFGAEKSVANTLGIQGDRAHLAEGTIPGDTVEKAELPKPKVGDYSLYGDPEQLEGKSWQAHGATVRVGKKIDRGGNAIIYECFLETKGAPAPLILKVIRTEGKKEDLVFRQAQFVKERNAMQSCNHPNVARITAHGQAGNDIRCHYLLMPRYGGGSLNAYGDIIRKASPAQLLIFLEKLKLLLHGLEHFHLRTHMAHLDINERNIFVQPGQQDLKKEEVLFHPSTQLILGDFGNVKSYLRPEDRDDLGESQEEDDEEFYACSPYSAAPEQAIKTQLRVTPNTDIWSFGTMLHEIFSGEPVFDIRDESFTAEQLKVLEGFSEANRIFAKFQIRLAQYYKGEIEIRDLNSLRQDNPLPAALARLINGTWLRAQPKERKSFQAPALLGEVIASIRQENSPEYERISQQRTLRTKEMLTTQKETPSRGLFARIWERVSPLKKTG